MGYKQEVQAKKGPRQKLAHNERPNDLPPSVDWEEQERIKNTIKNSHLPRITSKGARSTYSVEVAGELAIMRRQGMSMRMISAATGLKQALISHWISEYPEFSQQWNECYSLYVLNVAEELVPRAEKMMEGLKLDGKKLPAKMEKRYLRAFERLSIETHWAATHRVPEWYGDTDNGSELVIIQPQELERTVTQDVPAAISWKKEVDAKRAEDESRLQMADQPDAERRPGGGDDDIGGPTGSQPTGSDKPVDKRRKPRRSRPMVEPPRSLPAPIESTSSLDGRGPEDTPDPGQ